MDEDLVNQLREMLSLDPTLRPVDRRVLESLLLSPRPSTARELSRVAKTNAQSVYNVLDRLEERGLVIRSAGVRIRLFQTAHPSALLQELIDPGRKLSDLASKVEGPLRRLYEAREAPSLTFHRESASTTVSLTASLSSLLDLIRTARQEVWVVGSDDPWVSRSRAIQSELASRCRSPDKISVRLLVRKPAHDPSRSHALDQLRRAGAEIRFTDSFLATMSIVDRRFVVLRSAPGAAGGRPPTAYSRLDAPELAADIVRVCEQEWTRLDRTARSGSGSSLTSAKSNLGTASTLDRSQTSVRAR